MQQALIAAQELGDEKMNLLQAILDKIEIKTRLLDQDFKNLGKYVNDTFIVFNLLAKVVIFIMFMWMQKIVEVPSIFLHFILISDHLYLCLF